MNKRFWIILVAISYLVIFAGAINAGVSGYLMAVPFMVFTMVSSRRVFKNWFLLVFSILYIVGAIYVSQTQTKNPFLFPVIKDGYVTVLKDGYQETFNDGSGGFSEDKELENKNIGIGTAKYIKINKGDEFKVIGVRLRHPDFSQTVDIVTEIGEFNHHDYMGSSIGDPTIQLNKPVRAKWADNVSFFVIWIILPITVILYGLIYIINQLIRRSAL